MTYLEFAINHNGTGNQKHHIVPQSVQRGKNGVVTDERVVYLSPADHLYAHILYDIENGTYTSRYMRNASGLSKKNLKEITYEDCLIYNSIKEQADQAKRGKPLTREVKQKIAEGHKGKKHSEETKQKMAEAKRGRKPSDETRRKLSEAHKGKKLSKESIRKRLETMKGYHHSEEARLHMSEAKKGKPHPSPMEGKHHSKETKQRMSEAHKGKKWYTNGAERGLFTPGTEPSGYVPGMKL